MGHQRMRKRHSGLPQLSRKYRHPRDYIHQLEDDDETRYANVPKELRESVKKKASKYPWALLRDGGWWELTKGVDYTVSSKQMVINIHVYGYRNGLRAHAYCLPHGNAVRLKFYVGSPAYLDTEDHGVQWPKKKFGRY